MGKSDGTIMPLDEELSEQMRLVDADYDRTSKFVDALVAASRNIHWRYVPGHAGVPGNERADAIASATHLSALYAGTNIETSGCTIVLCD